MNLTILHHGSASRSETQLPRLRPFAAGALVLAVVLTVAAIAVSGFAINLGRLNSAMNNGSLANSDARFSEPLVEIGAIPADSAQNDRP